MSYSFNLKLVALLLFIIPFKVLSGHGYNGAVSIYSKGSDTIALHEHGGAFNPNNNRWERYSSIEIMDLSGNKKNNILINSYLLVALKWTDNDEYLVGLSNIRTGAIPNIVVYSREGEVLAEYYVNCETEQNGGFFCNKGIGQHWASWTLNTFLVEKLNGSIHIRLGDFSTNIEL